MYSSVDDVRAALAPGGSPSNPGTAATLPEDQIISQINEADGVIDAHIGVRYNIPQDSVNSLVAVSPIRWWSRTIAAYLATLVFKQNKDVGTDEPIRLRYEEVMQFLRDVRDGKMDLNLLAGTATTDSGEVYVYNLYEGDLFTKEMFVGPIDQGGWHVSGYVKLKY